MDTSGETIVLLPDDYSQVLPVDDFTQVSEGDEE